MQCKYCYNEVFDYENAYPCSCKQPVHKECLIKWIEKRKSDFTKCEICKADYKNISIYLKAQMKLTLYYKRFIIILSWSIIFYLILVFFYNYKEIHKN